MLSFTNRGHWAVCLVAVISQRRTSRKLSKKSTLIERNLCTPNTSGTDGIDISNIAAIPNNDSVAERFQIDWAY